MWATQSLGLWHLRVLEGSVWCRPRLVRQLGAFAAGDSTRRSGLNFRDAVSDQYEQVDSDSSTARQLEFDNQTDGGQIDGSTLHRVAARET